MRSIAVVPVALIIVGTAGCHAAVPPRAAERAAERTVFTDSVLHTQLCQANRPGEDWRRVCTPLDQSARPIRPLPSVPQPYTPP